MYKTYLLKISCIVEGARKAWSTAWLTGARVHQHRLEVGKELKSLGLLDQISRLGKIAKAAQASLGRQELLQGVGHHAGVTLRGGLLEVSQGILEGQSRLIFRNFVR